MNPALHAERAVRRTVRRWRVPALLGYVAIVALATLTRLHPDLDPSGVAWRLYRALTPDLRAHDVIDGVRNVLLFAGFGVVWVATAKHPLRWRTVSGATSAGCALSACVEIVQLVSRTRVASVLDVVTNTLGALLGAAAMAALITAAAALRRRATLTGVPLLAFAGPYAVVAVCEAFAPKFRLVRDWVAGGPLERLARALREVRLESVAQVPRMDGILFVPLGALAAAALVELGVPRRSAWWAATLALLLLAMAAELARGPLGQPIVLGPVLVRVAGIAVGAIGACVTLPRRRAVHSRGRGARLLAAAYAGVLVLWSWRPFRLSLEPWAVREQLSWTRFVPLRAFRDSVDVFAVADVAQQFFLLLPVGALLAVWPLRRTGPLRGVLPALLLAVLLEAPQIALVGRYFDITDVLVPFAGASIGWLVMRRAGYVPLGALAGGPDDAGDGARVPGRVDPAGPAARGDGRRLASQSAEG